MQTIGKRHPHISDYQVCYSDDGIINGMNVELRADGGSSSSANPSHTFAVTGSYHVTLVVFDSHGDQVRVTKTVSVA